MNSFIRGDTLPLKFKINYKDKNVVQLNDIATLTLTCRKYTNENSPILFKKDKEDFTLSDDFYHVVIKPENTQNLDYGVYNFDIECVLNDGYTKTLKGEFKITDETTIHKIVSNEVI